jgi:hypothetical protein
MAESNTTPTATPTLVAALKLLAGFAICAALVAATRPMLIRAASLYPLELPQNPHFVPEHALLLYIIVPAGLCAFLVILLAPGLLAVLIARGATSVTDLVVRGFAAAFALRWILGVFVTSVVGHQWSAASFFAVDLAVTTLLSAWLLFRVRAGTAPAWPRFSPVERRRLAAMVALPVVIAVTLLPWFLWQDMNGDGFEILITGRSLAEFPMPRFPHPSGFQGLGLGIIATAFPVHWFSMWIGPFEAAARFPFLLYLPLLFAVLVELIEHRSPRRLDAFEELALALALCAFAATLAFNGSYADYTADIAMPAGTDSLAVFCIAGTVLSLWRRETTWLLGFALIGYFARPSELLLLLLLGIAVVAAPSGERAGWILRVAGAVLLCIGARFLYENVYAPWASGGMRPGYLSNTMIRRLQYLTFFDVRRFLFLVVPSGFVAAGSLVLVRRQDSWSRTLTLACAAYFLFFYVQAFIALHHFAPIMVLPLVVWWRLALGPGGFRRAALVAAAGAVAAILLALPPQFHIYRSARAIGERTAFRIGDYQGRYAELRRAIDGARVLETLFPPRSRVVDPSKELAVSNLEILHYASRFAPDVARADYLVQPATNPPPAGFIPVAWKSGVGTFVRDSSVWQRDRQAAPSTNFASAIYAIPDVTRFSFIGIRAGNYDFNLGTLPLIWRLF